MKKYICLMVIISITTIIYGEKVTVLNKINKPELIDISDNILYIMEGATIYQYGLEDMKLIRTFGKSGEGPGELKVNQGIPNYIILTSNSIIAASMDKAIEFSKDGKVIREFKIPIFTNYLYPIKKGFIGMKIELGKKPLIKVKILDKELKEKKIIYSQKMSGGQNLVDLTYDGINIAVEHNKLYIDQSAKGFEIGVFDMDGNQINNIKKDVPKILFTDQHKNEALAVLKNNPQIKSIGWKNFTNMVKIINQKYLPPIQDMVINDDKIYIRTNNKKEDKVEFLSFNKNGQELKKYYLPRPIESGFSAKVFGRPGRYYKFYKNYYYYIVENEDNEEWELHRIKL